MVRMNRRRLARRAPKRGPRRARFARTRRPGSGNGYLALKRKAEPVYVRNSASAGVPSVSGAVGSMITLGTAESAALQFGGQNIFNVPFACQFSLDQIIASSEITNLADRYKIKSVTLKWKYNSNQYTAPNTLGLNPSQPKIYWITDHDDSTPLAVTLLRQKQGLKSKVVNSNREVTMTLSPRVAPAVFGGGVSTGYAIASRPMYINSSYNQVPHFGIKGYIEGMSLETTANLASVFTIDATFVVEAKDFQ